ncbi:MAG: hypothetical protein NW224_05670 [Leptolyngbyaceae cyanobacterium bins.302]|nr:hypothetical protein [Leptolyngbyaceae cyanobacterium bins.302]
MTLATRPAKPPTLRKHTDPPGLWLSVFVGSLLLNGILLVSSQRYLHQLEPLPSAFAPISIDFVPSDIQHNPETATRSEIAPATNSSKTISTPSQNQTTTTSSPNPTQPEAGKISMASAAPRPTQTATPPTNVKPQAPSKPSTSTQAESKAPSNTVTSPQTDTTSTEVPASVTNEPTPPQSTDEVTTSGMLLPGFTEPPDPRAHPGDTQATPTNSLPLSRSAPISKFLMQVKVFPAASDRPTAASSNPDLPQQSKTLSSGESGCLVTPEALHYFNQPLTYTLTLDAQRTVVNAVPVSPTSNALKSYQDLATCSLKTWTFEPLPRSSAPTQREPNQLVVQIILQKQ